MVMSPNLDEDLVKSPAVGLSQIISALLSLPSLTSSAVPSP